MEIDVIESEKLSSFYDKRYVIVNKETREVIDDAQGFGYKSKRNAYVCFGYKNRDKAKENKIFAWINKHKSFCREVADNMFYGYKDDPDFKADSKFIEECFKESNLTFDGFTAKEFLRVFNRAKF